MAARPPRVLWHIYEEHLEEAAFLWTQWERARVAANYTLSECVAGPEVRLAAHLRALAAGGAPVAERLVLPAAQTPNDPESAFAAIWALIHTEDVDYCEAAFHALLRATDPEVFGAMGRAFELSHRADLPARLAAQLDAVEPARRGPLLDTIVAHGGEPLWRIGVASRLERAHPEELPALLRAVAHEPDPACVHEVELALRSQDPATRDAALAAAVALGPSSRESARRAAAQAVAEQTPQARLPLALLALSPDANDQALVGSWLGSATPERRQDAAWALGFLGTRAALDQLCELLEDSDLAPTAGESLATITGLLLEEELVGEVPAEIAAMEPDDELGESRLDEGLDQPNAQALRRWWQEQRPSFAASMRFVGGAPFSEESFRRAAETRPLWRRTAFSLAVGLWGGELSSLRVRGWGKPWQR